MKKLAVLISLFFILAATASSQNINVNVNFNLDKQPAWGPSGYDYVEFYYFPDINIYYDVTGNLFYYLSGSKWISNRFLPDSYRKYDLYSMYKVVLNDKQPWLQNKNHKKQYAQFKGDKTQEAIRYNQDNRYESSRKNNMKWVNPQAPVSSKNTVSNNKNNNNSSKNNQNNSSQQKNPHQNNNSQQQNSRR